MHSGAMQVWRTADEAGFEVCCLLPGLTIQDIRYGCIAMQGGLQRASRHQGNVMHAAPVHMAGMRCCGVDVRRAPATSWTTWTLHFAALKQGCNMPRLGGLLRLGPRRNADHAASRHCTCPWHFSKTRVPPADHNYI